MKKKVRIGEVIKVELAPCYCPRTLTLVMWLLLNLHLLYSSPSSFITFNILNILTLLLPPLSSSVEILAVTNGTVKAPSSNSILPGNVTDMELSDAMQLTGSIMGLLPSILENQTEAEKSQLSKQVKSEVEKFFGELNDGGGGGEKNESEEKVEEKKDECTSRPCNPKAVCIAIGEYFHFRNKCLFLAVQNSSIGDLVTHSLTDSLSHLLIFDIKEQS